MNANTWTCAETDAWMEAYRVGELEASRADQLFEHAMRCPRCHQLRWRPYCEEVSWLVDDLLDAMIGPEPSMEGSPSTVDGGALLHLMDWTASGALSPPDRPPARADMGALAAGAIRGTGHFQAEHAAAYSSLSGPQLRQVGTVLPRVPRRRVLTAYQLHLGDGLPGLERTPLTAACLRVEVEGERDRVMLEALSEEVLLDGEAVPKSRRVPLRWTHLIEAGEQSYLFEAADRKQSPWMGVGIIRHAGPGWPLSPGDTSIGRGEANAIPLPDRVVRTNLEWRPGALEAITDPQERQQLVGLTLDAVEVSREHAVLTRTSSGLELKALAAHPVFVRDGDRVRACSRGERGIEVRPGCELRIGQQLFEYSDG